MAASAGFPVSLNTLWPPEGASQVYRLEIATSERQPFPHPHKSRSADGGRPEAASGEKKAATSAEFFHHQIEISPGIEKIVAKENKDSKEVESGTAA
nr:hypothetical protein [uncultured Rhodopila sp.]